MKRRARSAMARSVLCSRSLDEATPTSRAPVSHDGHLGHTERFRRLSDTQSPKNRSSTTCSCACQSRRATRARRRAPAIRHRSDETRPLHPGTRARPPAPGATATPGVIDPYAHICGRGSRSKAKQRPETQRRPCALLNSHHRRGLSPSRAAAELPFGGLETPCGDIQGSPTFFAMRFRAIRTAAGTAKSSAPKYAQPGATSIGAILPPTAGCRARCRT